MQANMSSLLLWLLMQIKEAHCKKKAPTNSFWSDEQSLQNLCDAFRNTCALEYVGHRREALPWASRNTCQRAGAEAVLHVHSQWPWGKDRVLFLLLIPSTRDFSPNSGEAQNEFDLQTHLPLLEHTNFKNWWHFLSLNEGFGSLSSKLSGKFLCWGFLAGWIVQNSSEQFSSTQMLYRISSREQDFGIKL